MRTTRITYPCKGHEFEARPPDTERMVCVRCGFATSYVTLRRVDYADRVPACEGGGGMSTALVPEVLSGGDGDVTFVRRDLADTPVSALAVAFSEGRNLAGYEADEVEMLPVPEHFTGIDEEWATVREGTPGAVKFWRFQC